MAFETDSPKAGLTPASKYRSAATYGLYLGLYLAVFYLLDAFAPKNAAVKALSTLGDLGMFFVVYFLIKTYRERRLGGIMSYGQAWSFGFWLFAFASLITAAVAFIHLQFLQPDYLITSIDTVLNTLEQNGMTSEQMDSLLPLRDIRPIQVSFFMIWMYLIGGALLSLIYAAFLRKEPLI